MILAFLAVLVAVGSALPDADAQPSLAVIPVQGEISRAFDPPEQTWLPGHRGVDIVAQPGQNVVAALDGVVSFAGLVAGRPVISINHGDKTTTYEPVQSLVTPGQSVQAGQVIGTVVAGHLGCTAAACLHWGLKQGDSYLDPLSLLPTGSIRLVSADALEAVRTRAAELTRRVLSGQVSAAGLIMPVTGVISDEYGMRLHPIEGVWKFHDGLDLAADCGSVIVAAAAGKVTESSFSPGYGNRLVIDHGLVAGHALITSYNHAQGYAVGVGDQVQQGQVIGWVGSTGESTGCHLHLQAWVDGTLSDPLPLLP